MSTLEYGGYLGWRSEGIARAIAAGGVPLERHFTAGFAGGPSVRRAPYPIEQEASDHVTGHEPEGEWDE